MTHAMNRRQVIAGTVAASVVPSVVAAMPRRSLTETIGVYLAARAAHDAVEAAHGDAAYSRPEWDAYLEAERALVSHRCADDGERRTKIAFALMDRPFLDTIERDALDGVSTASRFLSSLI